MCQCVMIHREKKNSKSTNELAFKTRRFCLRVDKKNISTKRNPNNITRMMSNVCKFIKLIGFYVLSQIETTWLSNSSEWNFCLRFPIHIVAFSLLFTYPFFCSVQISFHFWVYIFECEGLTFCRLVSPSFLASNQFR